MSLNKKARRNLPLLKDLSINLTSMSVAQIKLIQKNLGCKQKKEDEREAEVIKGVILPTVNTVSVIAVTIKRKLRDCRLFFLLLLTSALYNPYVRITAHLSVCVFV